MLAIVNQLVYPDHVTIAETTPTRREQILDAAARLFADHGFHGVGIDDIGAAVGISGPGLYRHFRGKDAILGEMLTSISESLLDGGRRRARQASTPQDALDELVRFHVAFALEHPDLITVQERNLANLREDDRHAVRRLQRRYVDVWADAICAVHEVPAAKARAGAHAVFGLINSTPHTRSLGRMELADLLADLADGALRNIA